MKKIKYTCLKKYNAFIVFLISFLGFASSCDILGGKAMYGTPSADFIVKGKVEDTDSKNPIVGVKMEMSREMNSKNGKVFVDVGSSFSVESTGKYEVTDNQAFPEDQNYKIKFRDIDGVQNGEYEPLDTTIIFQNPKFAKGDGSWYIGQTEKVVNVELKPKK